MDPIALMSEVKEYLEKDQRLLNGPFYESLCKQTADACFKSGLVKDGIFYLSESHAANLRSECFQQYTLKLLQNEFKNLTSHFTLNQEHVSFSSPFVTQKYDGLMARLKEMPKEWILLQITQPFEPQSRWNTKLPNSVTNVSALHIVRYSCGDSREPCHVLIPKPEKRSDLENNSDLLQELNNISIKNWLSMRKLPSSKIKLKRIEDNKQLKMIVKDITRYWLKEWSCMLLGKLKNDRLEEEIVEIIDKIISKSSSEVDVNSKALLYQITTGSAHLSEAEIESAVTQVVKEASLQKNLCQEIESIRNKYSNLIVAKRHPIILILDEKLECIPWEMIPVLWKHPVTRIPSIHFAHALFKEHEHRIVDGNVMVSDCDSAYYLINPDQDLQSTEKRVTPFIKMRFPSWHGLSGTSPSKDEFIGALENYNLFLYCGHGNGTQFLRSSDIKELRVRAIPLLFGCSSFQHKNLGGRASYTSLCNSYIIAGSPCMLGALWPITNSDTDCMALTLLNHWLPGKQLDLRTLEGFSEETVIPNQSLYEPELLRALKLCRDSAILFSNSASLVLYGLPVKVTSPNCS